MNRLQMTKRALISYVNAVKFIWSELAHPLTIVGKKNMNLRDYKIYGNSIQDGTPTPENPIEVQSVGELVTEGEYAGKYKIPVTARGKNLLKPLRVSAGGLRTATSKANTSNNYGTSINTTDATEEIIVTQTKAPNTTNLNSYTNGFFCIEIGSGVLMPGTRYTLSFDCEITNSLLNSNQIMLMPNGGNIGNVHFSVLNGRNSIAFNYAVYNGIDNYLEFRIEGKSLKISNIMITDEDGTPVYEPYIEPQTFNIYLDEPLRKVGDYADYVDFVKRVVTRKIAERTIRSFSWGKYSDSSEPNTGLLLYRYEATVANKRLFTGGWSDVGNLMCNGLKNTGYNGNHVMDESISERTQGHRNIKILTSYYDTLTSMREAYGDFKVTYILDDAYVKEEPIELPELPTFKGTTIYEIATEIKPSGMEVKYC